MTVLLWSMILITLAFMLHVVLWRIRLPKRQTRTMLLLFFTVMIIGNIVLLSSSITILNVSAPSSLLECLHISLFFTSLTLAYMITYSAMEADSPSLVIITSIARAGSSGIAKEDFDEALNDDVLVKPRINDLLRDEMAYLDGDRYRLTPKGIRFARIFIVFRGLLKAPKGG